MLNRGMRRLTVRSHYGNNMQTLTVSKVNLDEIRSHNKELSDGLLNNPFEHSQAFDAALKRVITALPNRPPIESSDDVVRLGLRLLNPVMSRTSSDK